MTDEKQTISLEVTGQLDLDTFAAAVTGLRELANSLSAGLTPHANVIWELEDLKFGSATVTLRAESHSVGATKLLARAYSEIWTDISLDRKLNYSRKISESARKLATLTKRKRVTGIRCATGSWSGTLTSVGPNLGAIVEPVSSIGSVTGQIEALSRRGDLHLTMIDDVFSSRVTLHLKKGQEELARQAWNIHATVSGTIIEEPGFGRPTDVRDVLSIEPIEDFPVGSWRKAQGAFPWIIGDPPAEQTIREVRGRA